MLDAGELDSVGVEAFFLNACQSYEQGMALIEAGSIGGVVTLNDVINSGAVRVGKAMAQLLNRGFPLSAALNIARDRSIIGGQYTIVGDGSINVVQTESIAAVLFDIETKDEMYEVTPITYLSNESGIGGFVSLRWRAITDCSYLASGELTTFTLDGTELIQLLGLENVPIRLDRRFMWSYALEMNEMQWNGAAFFSSILRCTEPVLGSIRAS